jgi:hypothetical protein
METLWPKRSGDRQGGGIGRGASDGTTADRCVGAMETEMPCVDGSCTGMSSSRPGRGKSEHRVEERVPRYRVRTYREGVPWDHVSDRRNSPLLLHSGSIEALTHCPRYKTLSENGTQRAVWPSQNDSSTRFGHRVDICIWHLLSQLKDYCNSTAPLPQTHTYTGHEYAPQLIHLSSVPIDRSIGHEACLPPLPHGAPPKPRHATRRVRQKCARF